jgi:two-component system chemotaxis response regulator CheB
MTTSQSRVRVLIVDDSALMRQLLSSCLAADPQIEVVGAAADPLEARDMIKALNPDVVTLDVEMPKMDGVTFLRKIMTLRPMPVVMISTLTQAGAEVTLEALEIGAVDFIAKPTRDIGTAMTELAGELQAKVKAAARVRVRARHFEPKTAESRPAKPKLPAGNLSPRKIVTIGASTGGVEALKLVLMHLPADCPPILITQHMPERFTASFARRLDQECAMRVSEACHGDVVEQGHVYIAPGARHLELARSAGRFVCRLTDDPPVSGHRPSVDVLFRSAAQAAGPDIVGVILTGMGKDGSEGMVQLRGAGAVTLGQDEASSLIYGMPRVAFERGAVQRQYPLADMAAAILQACQDKPNAGLSGKPALALHHR